MPENNPLTMAYAAYPPPRRIPQGLSSHSYSARLYSSLGEVQEIVIVFLKLLLRVDRQLCGGDRRAIFVIQLMRELV